MSSTPNIPVAEVKDLKVHYPIRSSFMSMGEKKTLKAVNGVSFTLNKGEILGLVGESGCGKSSLGLAILQLIKVTDGHVTIDGVDFLSLKGKALREARPKIQMIFQDPYASLDPRMTVSEILAEPAKAHLKLSEAELSKKIRGIMDLVCLPMKSLNRYPHEFSGGQRQRIAIGRSLILEPKIIIADEPVSSLDVSVQAQILNLLKDIRDRLGLSMIFISHNLAVVKYISDRIAVMYLGKIVEIATREDLYRQPMHPYTQALVSAVPVPDPRIEKSRQRIALTGEIPSPINTPKCCAFHTRCPLVFDRCRQEPPPELKTFGATTHRVACFAVEQKKN